MLFGDAGAAAGGRRAARRAAGRRERHRRRRLARPTRRLRDASPWSSTAPTTWWCCTTRARSASLPRSGGAGSRGSCHVNASQPGGGRPGRGPPLVAGCDLGVLVPDRSLPARPPSRRARPRGRRRASTRSTRATSSSSRACRAGWCAPGRGPRPPFVLQTLRARPLGRPARDDRVLPPRARGGAGPPAGAGRPARRGRDEAWRAAKEVSDYAGGTTGVLLLTCYEPLGSLELGALQHLARVVLETSLGEGLRPRRRARRCGSARRSWAAAAAASPSRCATAWTASSPTTPRPDRGAARGARPRPGPGGGDGPRRPRAGPRALPRDRGGRARAARAGRAALTAVRPPIRSPVPWCAVKVLLPDGNPLELSDGATGADAAARDRRGPGPRRARHPRQRERRRARAARPDRAAAGRRRASRSSRPRAPRTPGAALAHPPRRRARAGHGGHGALPRRQGLDRPADRGRLLLRLRVPRGRDASRSTTSSASRSGCASTSRPTRRSSAPTLPAAEAHRALPGRGPGLQGGADRGPRARPGRGHRLALPERPVHRPLPRAARARAPSGSRPSSSRRSRARTGAATPTARCSPAIYGTAFLSQGGPRGAPRAARGGPRARPPQARPRARPVHALRPVARACRSGCPRARTSGTSSRGSGAPSNVERGYREVRTPILYDVELWKQSGHWDVYRDHMYFTDVEGQPMGLKPMNCPAHVQIYKRDLRSYRDLPIRYAEQGLVHRHEPSGTLHGLLRVRHITQDDAHVFCTEEQIEEEVLRCLDFGFFIYDQFGFEPRLELSTRPEKRVGTRGDVGPGRGRAPGGAGEPRARVRPERGRRRLLRAEDRPAHDRRDRALVAARHRPARLLHARAVRARLHRRGQRRAPARR